MRLTIYGLYDTIISNQLDIAVFQLMLAINMDSQNTQFNSILDKVMAASQEKELASFNPVDIVTILFRELGSREQDILRRRFGLHGKGAETLEEIGKGYNVTRERVRQIENAAIKNIKNRPYYHDTLKPVNVVVLASLEKHGGLMAEDHLLEYILQTSHADPVARGHMLFLLSKLGTEKVLRDEVPGHIAAWRLDFVGWEKAKKTIEELTSILEKHGEPLTEDELLNHFRETETFKNHREHFGFNEASLDPIYAHLRTSTKLKTNPYKEWGMANWKTVTPKRMGDKIYLVMKKHGQPLHFRAITEKINQAGFDAKKAYAPTVHNELILDDRYVLVGRGIYALKEWGYVPGVVADVISDVLKKAGQPLTRDEIVDKVMEQRLVKKGTVYLALASLSRFARNDEGKYYLNESASDNG